jgi:cytochrome c5
LHRLHRRQCRARRARIASIGDKEAWTPRLNDGLDDAVRIAIRAHGGRDAGCACGVD